MQPPFRIAPALPASSMQTYNITSPQRPATCAEVECHHHLKGWLTDVDESTELGQRQAAYMRGDRTRRHRESRTEGGLTRFAFEPGQTCFNGDAHTLPLVGRELFIVRDGDWRGNPTGRVRRHANPADWVEDFALHQQGVAAAVKRG